MIRPQNIDHLPRVDVGEIVVGVCHSDLGVLGAVAVRVANKGTLVMIV